MNIKEFVDLYRNLDILNKNNDIFIEAFGRVEKNFKNIRTWMFLACFEFGLLIVHGALNDRDIRRLERRIYELEKKDIYESVEAVDPAEEEIKNEE